MPPRTDRRDRQHYEESFLQDPFMLARHIQRVNSLSDLRIVYHGLSGEPQNITHMELTYLGGGPGILEMHLASALEDLPEFYRRDAEEIQYKEPLQEFTVIGPSNQFDGDTAAYHLKARSWIEVVRLWRNAYAPNRNWPEDPTVLEGFMTPLSNIAVIPYSAQE